MSVSAGIEHANDHQLDLQLFWKFSKELFIVLDKDLQLSKAK